VLWEGVLPMWPIPVPSQVESKMVWKTHAAFDNKQDCDEMRTRVLPVWEDRKAEETKKPPDRQIIPVRLICLPDTIDPRGPKGGSR